MDILSKITKMITLKQFLAELSYTQLKEISRHAKGLLLALEKSNRKEMLEYEVREKDIDWRIPRNHPKNCTCMDCSAIS